MSVRSRFRQRRRAAWTGAVSAVLGCLAPVTSGCGSTMPAAHPPLGVPSQPPSELLVGTSRVDVTPPPGPSTFGHGPGARVAVGYWTRLYCRAFYFEPRGRPEAAVAIVACELPQISTLLQRHSASRIEGLPAARLMLVATHTHAGPGHYFESENLGGATSAHFPGFDPLMVEFLSERIASAVSAAREGKQLARVRWIGSDVWGLTRNRSLSAHRENPRWPGRPTPPVPLELSEEQRAIDPRLRVLQIERLDEASGGPAAPLGMLAFFAMHPTVVRNRNRLFGGDVFGVASRLLESELRRQALARGADLGSRGGGSRGSEPIAALINTNEGDLVPVWSQGDLEEAKAIGARLARHVWQTRAACEGRATLPEAFALRCEGWQERPRLELAYVETKLPGAPRLPTAADPAPKPLCDAAEIGLAAALGGSDHPTSLESLLSSGEAVVDLERRDCQAPKVPFLGPVQRLMRTGAFPEQVPLALLRLGETWISFLPAELTFAAGARVNEAVLAVVRSAVASTPAPTADAVVAGLANGYMQYVTTPEEYERQRYEGGATLYGPASGPYLAEVMAALAQHLLGRSNEAELARMTRTPLGAAEPFAYGTAPERERLWRADWDAELAEVDGRGPLQVCRLSSTEPPALCFRWIDGGPSRVPLTREPWLRLVQADSGETLTSCVRARLGQEPEGLPCDPGARFDDRGLDFATRIHHRQGRGWVWSSVFRASADAWRALPATLALRFVVGAQGAVPIQSDAFSPGALPPRCEREIAARYCEGTF